MEEITKEQFDSYTIVQDSLKYNMELDALDAAIEAMLDLDTYWTILNNYDELEQKFYGG
jgi:hypothetical protein